MMVNTNIYGYVFAGGTFHPQCVEERPGPDRDDISALYYLDDEDPHGMTCDTCSEYIFEPVGPHRIEPDGTCEYGCFDWCGDTESCWLHQQTATEDRPAVRFERDETDRLNAIWTAPALDYPAEED